MASPFANRRYDCPSNTPIVNVICPPNVKKTMLCPTKFSGNYMLPTKFIQRMELPTQKQIVKLILFVIKTI